MSYHLDQMSEEYSAWQDVVSELRDRGVGAIEHGEKDFTLYTAIVRWGEELAELRRYDPDPSHAANALTEKRMERIASTTNINKEA